MVFDYGFHWTTTYVFYIKTLLGKEGTQNSQIMIFAKLKINYTVPLHALPLLQSSLK